MYVYGLPLYLSGPRICLQRRRLRFDSWVDPLEEGMATHSSVLAWRLPWTEEPGRLYSPRGCKSRT